MDSFQNQNSHPADLESRLRELEEVKSRLETLANAIPQMAWIANAQGIITFYNDRWYEYTGIPRGTGLGNDWLDLIHPEDREKILIEWSRCLQEGCDYQIEVRFRRASDQQYRWILVRALPTRDAQGRITSWTGTNTDIHERKQLEEELRTAKERIEQASEATGIGFWEWDFRTNQTSWTSGVYRILGINPEEAPPDFQTLVDTIHPEDRDRALQVLQKSIQENTPQLDEFRVRTRDGRWIWIENRGTVIKNAQGQPVCMRGTNVDITDRKIKEQKLEAAANHLRESEERLKLAMQASGIGIWQVNLKTGEAIWSETEYELFGIDPKINPQEAIGDYHLFHPEDRDLVRKEFEMASRGLKDFRLEFRILNPKDPDGFRWISAKATLLRDSEGRPSKVIGTDVDVTALKKAAQAALEAKKAADSANQMKSAFLANMSHEIRTPLGALLGFTELLADESSTAAERSEYSAIIKRNGEQLTDLIDDILDLSKIEAGQLKFEAVATSANSVLKDVCDLLGRKAQDKGLQLDYSLDSELPGTIWTDPTRLKQILINVVGNAIKFTMKGSVHVRASYDKSQRKVLFTVSDTGIGLSEDHIKNLFVPFSQADDSITRRFGGTGLGLSLAKKLAHGLGGDLLLRSSVLGQGSTFEISIHNSLSAPLSPASETPSPTSINPPGNLEALRQLKVLLVEDSEDNQKLISSILGRYGVQLELANNGLEGVERVHWKDFDLILMDIQMSLMDGLTATRILREQGFKKPIIALTAHALVETRDRCRSFGCTDFLAKPIDRAELVRKIVACTQTPEASK